jgi:hypothetical protein
LLIRIEERRKDGICYGRDYVVVVVVGAIVGTQGSARGKGTRWRRLGRVMMRFFGLFAPSVHLQPISDRMKTTRTTRMSRIIIIIIIIISDQHTGRIHRGFVVIDYFVFEHLL